MRKKFEETWAPWICSGSPAPVSATSPNRPPTKAAMPSNTWFCSRQSRKFAGAGVLRGISQRGTSSHTITSRSPSGYGKGASSIAFTRLKIAVFAPTPKPRDRMATAVKTGLRRSWRRANRTSRSTSSRRVHPHISLVVSRISNSFPNSRRALRSASSADSPRPMRS